jgi:glycosyltransferase involved in cell wall biosynthesis
MKLPAQFHDNPSIHWVGPTARSEVIRHYNESDVLVFPSLSDGFGIVQVEAQGSGLPVIASQFCGRVVDDGENGILLSDVSACSIAHALRRVVLRPQLLDAFSRRALEASQASVPRLATHLLELETLKSRQ